MLHMYLPALRRRWWLLPPGVALAVAIAALVNLSTPPRYQSTVRLIATQAAPASAQSYSDILADQEIAKTYAKLATTARSWRR